jgi:hypothetical protein
MLSLADEQRENPFVEKCAADRHLSSAGGVYKEIEARASPGVDRPGSAGRNDRRKQISPTMKNALTARTMNYGF